jgi:hypothetical protein
VLETKHLIIKNAHRPTCTSSQDDYSFGAIASYTVLKATLTSGEEMVVDFTGAQFGWEEIVAPWLRWTEQRLAVSVAETVTAGVNSDKFHAMQDIISNIEHDARFKDLHQDPESLYGLEDTAYMQAISDILATVDMRLAETAQLLRTSKDRRYYLDYQWNLRAIACQGEADILKKIWFTQQDWATHKHDPGYMRRRWTGRCKSQAQKPGFATSCLRSSRVVVASDARTATCA